ncbi:S8 family serine peptidase [Thermomonospora amylolytica]|uniref:S8 family serine peptidase n=1 Tax=Thermomonospora amylolytica TaxID=1411117 RepID=UPI000E6C0C6C|nr:S8 family serine peptidase [Thermomonospora amylolytica]
MAMLMATAAAAPGAAAAQAPRAEQWWFTTWGIQDQIWPHSKGAGVTVAVLDSGVQADIPELAGAVVPGLNLETGSGDGRTDQDSAGGGHGTGMATTIASRGGPTGFMGVAPEAKILPVVAQGHAALVKGIRAAADRGARVINISKGAPGSCPDDMQQAIKYAIDRNAVVVASAGNTGHTDNSSLYPANCRGVLAVGGSTIQNGVWANSQRHPYVDVAAPAEQAGAVVKDGRYWTSDGGTSSAAALTSGAIALVMSKYPKMSNREVVRQLIASAKDIGPAGRDDRSGHGLIRPRLIFSGEVPKNTGNSVFEEYDQWAKSAGGSGGSGDGGSGGSNAPVKAPKTDNTGSFVIFGIVGGAFLLILVVGLFMTRRNRRPAPMVVAPPGAMPGGMGHSPMPPTPMPAPGQMGGPPPSMGGGQMPPVPPQGPPQPPGGQPQFHPPQQGEAPPRPGPYQQPPQR